MPLLKRAPEPEPKTALGIKIKSSIHDRLVLYAEFVGGATTQTDVVEQALEYVFRKDKAFEEWLAKRPVDLKMVGEPPNAKLVKAVG